MNWNSIIHSPGKFEGNPEAVRELWENAVMNGDGEEYYDECGDLFTVLELLPEERPDKNTTCAVLWEDSLGFVMYELFNDYKDAIDTLEA